MPATVQECISYINAHIYENTEQEVSATEVKTALLMMLEVIQTFVPKGEFVSDEAARAANLVEGDTYVLSAGNPYGINKRGVQITLFDE
jgi:hypothetical protein